MLSSMARAQDGEDGSRARKRELFTKLSAAQLA